MGFQIKKLQRHFLIWYKPKAMGIGLMQNSQNYSQNYSQSYGQFMNCP